MGNHPLYFWQLITKAPGAFSGHPRHDRQGFLFFNGDERLMRISKFFLGPGALASAFFDRF